MKDKVSRINNEFYKNFPEIYLKPSKVNKFLKKYTNEVEKEIKNKFLQLKLDKNFVIYANGGFGRKEIFPISDIDISIVEKNKPKDFIYGATTDYEKFKVNRALDFLEKKAPEFNSYINRVQITICLAFNTMYKNFPEENWKENRPLLNALVETFKQRKSFIDTEGK